MRGFFVVNYTLGWGYAVLNLDEIVHLGIASRGFSDGNETSEANFVTIHYRNGLEKHVSLNERGLMELCAALGFSADVPERGAYWRPPEDNRKGMGA